VRSRTHHARIPACVEIRRQRPPRRVAVAFEVGEGEVSAATERRRKPGLRDAGQQGEVPEYSLSLLDGALLALFRRALLLELGDKRDEAAPGFAGVAALIQRLHATSRDATHVQERGTRVLRALLPAWFASAFGGFLALLPPWFAARHASASSVLFLNWLVGPSEVVDTPEDLLPDNRRPVPPNAAAALAGQASQDAGYRQAVRVKRCRVLEETKCASVCLNVCQVPTQCFFTEDIGLPMTMSPNFDTFECTFSFGRAPPGPADSDSFTSPCFKQCGAALRSAHQCDVKPYPASRDAARVDEAPKEHPTD